MTGYLIFAGLVALYALAATKLEYLLVTGPIIFVAVGFLLGTGGTSLVGLSTGSTIVRVVAGITLALLLFSDASSVRLRALRRDASLIVMLLAVGLPLAIAFGTMSGWLLLPGLGIGAYALLASILAPTDLSLGLAMFKNPRVPERIRGALNVESGLNDGIAAPLVALFIGVAVAEAGEGARPVLEAVFEILIGVGVGVAVGAAGGLLLRLSVKWGWSSKASRQFGAMALALLAYGVALDLEGNGFIAAFAGGIAFGAVTLKAAVEAVSYSEETGTLLTLAVWFIFGAAVAPVLISDGLDWRPIVYALASLIVVRTLAVTFSLLGKKLHGSTFLFMGWFGPRGLASVAFLILALETLDAAGLYDALFVATAGWTILFSVVLHGLSAGPVAAWYGRRANGFAPGSPELESAGPIRRRHGLALPNTVVTKPEEAE